MKNNFEESQVKKAFTEVDEILKFLNKKELEKIPHDYLDYIKNNKSPTYEWNYDSSKTLEEQDLNEVTYTILAMINNEFLLPKKKRILMEKFYKLNEKK